MALGRFGEGGNAVRLGDYGFGVVGKGNWGELGRFGGNLE